jgi:hypothetical protein
MSNSIYPTLTTTIPLYNILVDHVENTISTPEMLQTIIVTAEEYKKKLLEYYNKTNDTYLIVTILDP